ncbi:MAG: ABC transporter permease, partial [Deltaproteobacteria bacterium]|nr:ABC transporter permease [Deltaproteobacteria bacterium]
LQLRNFFVLPSFVILLSAQSVAGELQARTLREELLRPVPRQAVLLAKWFALVTWSAASLGLGWVVDALGGMVLLGTSGPWAEVAAGYAAALLCDAGLAAVAMAVAVSVQGVAGAVVGTFLFLVLSIFAGWALYFIAWLAGIEAVRTSVGPSAWMLDTVVQLEPWLPPAALAAWRGISPEADWVWQSFAALAILTGIALGVAERRLARLDLP